MKLLPLLLKLRLLIESLSSRDQRRKNEDDNEDEDKGGDELWDV